MNYLPQLTEDEVRYICSVIPIRDAIAYFRNNPKEFSKIQPGFRAKAISKLNVSNLLFRYRNRGLISSFIEKRISIWLSQIQEHLDRCIEDGDSNELALLHTLPFSYFANNIALYFKLINENHSEDYITTISVAVKAIRELNDKKEKLQEELKEKESTIEKLQTEYELAKSNLESVGLKLNERLAEIMNLKRNISELEKLRAVVRKDEMIIAPLKVKIQEQERTIKKLTAELSNERDIRQQLEVHIRSELDKQQVAKMTKQRVEQKPKCPSDIEAFKDYLTYNLENIGVSTNSVYYKLLKEHLSKILFQGIPIVINRKVGITLMRCVANALIGHSNVNTLTFNKECSIEDVNCFLSSSERVVCLDNFIGNYNETELIPLFESYKNRIIFLTVAYDRTIYYVSREFLRYCHYLNLNRITALTMNAELTEDPSVIEEVESIPLGLHPYNRYSHLLKEMMNQLGFYPSLVEQKCATIFNEQDLCCTLAFDVLPYCVDVLQIAPYNKSERLLKYAGDTGRCPYKNLLKEWFEQ